jgi:FkbM family methyltransferase
MFAVGRTILEQTTRIILERTTRNWVFRRNLGPDFGNAPLFVTPSAGLKYLLKPRSRIDPSLLRCARELVRAGDVVWDIGANIGLFTFAAAARAGKDGKVVAVEPDAWIVQLLRRSCAIQAPSSSSVTVVPVAVGSDVSLRYFSIAVRSRASNALVGYGNTQMGGEAERQLVVTVNLDWLLTWLPAPNMIKIDVEGAELEVLKDQSRMLTEIRPIILCEVGSKNAEAIGGILKNSSYVLFDGEKTLVNAQPSNRAPWSTVAVPNEALLRLPRT